MNKVLIKHYDEGMRRAIARALSTWNYLSLETDDIHCVYELAAAEGPSIILLDPMKGTLSALSMLSAGRETASIPVIILSSSDDLQYERLCRREGVFDYLGSGWTLADLRNRIRMALPGVDSATSKILSPHRLTQIAPPQNGSVHPAA